MSGLQETDAAYLDAIESTTALADSGASPKALVDHVAAALTTVLGLRGCRFEANRFGGLPRLEPDGEGGWIAQKFPRDGAGILSSMVDSEGFAVLPEALTRIAPGDPIDFLPFREVID